MSELILKILNWFDQYNKGYHDGFEAGLQTRYVINAAHEKREAQERDTDKQQGFIAQIHTQEIPRIISPIRKRALERF